MLFLLSFTTSNVIPEWAFYVISGFLALLVLLGIYFMSKVEKAIHGNRLSAIALTLGIVITLIYYDILPVWLLYVTIFIGTIIGFIIAKRVKMTEMPELVGLLNGLGGASSAIVAGMAMAGIGSNTDPFSKVTSILALIVGTVTFFGSMVAAGKLHKVITQKPIVLPNHQLITGIYLLLLLILIIAFPFANDYVLVMIVITTILSALFGILFTIRVGGADMPITISLLNSLSGVAAGIAGLAINDILLVSIGGIVGASGLILTQIMCRSINHSLIDILLGKTTTKITTHEQERDLTSPKATTEETSEVIQQDPIEVLKNAKSAIIVPGYGMALAQAQHLVKKLSDRLTRHGCEVKFAIHPVAGRMPGHMNVLLAEAGIDYDELYEMEDINDQFKTTDVTIVIGANDVLNPAARNAVDTPIYGMPILNVDECDHVLIFNYDLRPGYAGVDNPLYKRSHGLSLFLGNAADTLTDVLTKL